MRFWILALRIKTALNSNEKLPFAQGEKVDRDRRSYQPSRAG